MRLKHIALFWGLAEATIFFIVPDVLLTVVATRNVKLAGKLCIWTLAGALLGGTIMFAWGQRNIETAEAMLLRVPAISFKMVRDIETQVAEKGAMATFTGPLTGKPYKIYAVEAGAETEVSFLAFLLISVPARILRFLLLSWVTHLICLKLLAQQSGRFKLRLLAGVWLSFYGWYFWVT